METAYFKNIRFELISSLGDAKEDIRIAVAWFTNQELFEVLNEKLKNGVKVSLIIIDDYINNGDFGLNFHEFISNGGKLYYGKEENPMHHKFCIIDNSILITGSYNWTYYAENKNEENIVKIENNKSLIEAFKNQFEILTSTLKDVQVPNKISLEELELKNIFSVKNYIALDLLFNGKENSKQEFFEKAKEFAPNHPIIIKEYKSFLPLAVVEKPSLQKQNTNQLIPKNKFTSISVGIKCRNKGKDNQFSSIIVKDTQTPCEFSHTYSTVYKDQTQMSIETYKGENEEVNKNIMLGKFLINDLPKKPAGEANVTVTMKLNANGDLIVIAKSNDTGNQMQANYYDKTLWKEV